MTYSLSEDLHEGSFKWIWLGGVEDTLAPYTAILTSEERSEGEHSQVELINNPTVVENALYTMTFIGQDRAGNKTKRAFVPGLQYDFTPPELTWIGPKDGAAVNHKNVHYSNSELLNSGTISWTWIDGVADPDSSHLMVLAGEELSGNEYGPDLIANEPPLVDGGIPPSPILVLTLLEMNQIILSLGMCFMILPSPRLQLFIHCRDPFHEPAL